LDHCRQAFRQDADHCDDLRLFVRLLRFAHCLGAWRARDPAGFGRVDRSSADGVKGIFDQVPRFRALVENVTADTISLKSRVDIQIRPASFRTIRGISAIAAIAEECSMWQSDELGSKNPDREILAAIRPALSTTNGPLFAIGSPHARRGETWRMFNRHFVPDGAPDILIANGPTRLFNPTIRQSVIDRAYEDDPAIAASESRTISASIADTNSCAVTW
jgi:hypothetical protein